MFSLLLPLNYLPLFLSVLNTVLVLPHFEIYEKSRFSFFFSRSQTFTISNLSNGPTEVQDSGCRL